MQASKEIANLINKNFTKANYNFNQQVVEQMVNYLLLLDKWNHAYNLTSVRDIKEMVPLHILDSLAIKDYIYGQRILDVGTGAGLPGIPLAVVQPEREFVLLDSNGKKTRFLTHVVQQLNLKNVTVVQARVENYQTDCCFASIVSRAFSELNDFLQKTQHLCCANGQFLAMKGQYPQAEIANIDKAFQLLAAHELHVPGLNAQRHLICFSKH